MKPSRDIAMKRITRDNPFPSTWLITTFAMPTMTPDLAQAHRTQQDEFRKAEGPPVPTATGVWGISSGTRTDAQDAAPAA
jgi:hypothetical protein